MNTTDSRASAVDIPAKRDLVRYVQWFDNALDASLCQRMIDSFQQLDTHSNETSIVRELRIDGNGNEILGSSGGSRRPDWGKRGKVQLPPRDGHQRSQKQRSQEKRGLGAPERKFHGGQRWLVVHSLRTSQSERSPLIIIDITMR